MKTNITIANGDCNEKEAILLLKKSLKLFIVNESYLFLPPEPIL